MDDERLVVMLEARIAEFEKRMKRAEGQGTRTYRNLRRGSQSATGAMERDMVRATTRVNQALASTTARVGVLSKNWMRGLAGGAIAAVFAGVTTNIAGTIKGIASLGDEAKRAGVSLQAFQEWKFVAEQNRIGIDAMTDGLKELNLRADEFIVTGAGPAAEAFARLGFNARDLETRLKDPSELLLEITGRLGDLDSAAQIRVADEVFGGSAGERFVELISQGEQGLRDTIARAHEVGAVLDEELVQKAADLDRRFNELTGRVGSFFKEFAVGAADAAVKIATLRTDLDDLFRTADQGRGLLGDGITDALEDDSDAIAAHEAEINALRRTYEGLGTDADTLSGQLVFAAAQLRNMGYDQAATDLMNSAEAMRELSGQMQDGTISADEFEAQLGETAKQGREAFMEVSGIDTAEFGGVISGLGGLIARLGEAAARARELRAAMPGANADGSTGGPKVYVEDGHFFDNDDNLPPNPLSEFAPGNSPRPRGAPSLVDDYSIPDTAPGGGGGGGGGAGGDEYRQATEAIREQIVALELEAAELIAVAAAGHQMGDAVEYARKRAELLVAAQKEGREITPELRAEIDQLALSYTRAGQDAETAADKLEAIEDQAERGADRLTDMFMGIASGSMKAKDAVIALLLELAKMKMVKGLTGLASGGGALGSFISAFGFSEGGYTGPGGKHDPAGIVHAGEFVVRADQVRRPGVRSMLEGINNGAMPVTAPSQQAAGRAQRVEVSLSGGNLTLSDGGEITAMITATARQAADQGALAGAQAGAERAVRVVKGSLSSWQQEYSVRGVIS